MTVLRETANVARPIQEAFAYVSDFTTTIEWDPTVIQAEKLTPGPVQVGTKFEVECALPVGSVKLQYQILRLEPEQLIELEGVCKFFTVLDTISFSRSDRGTKIDYQASFDFIPLLKPVISLSTASLETMGRESVAGLATALEDKQPKPVSTTRGKQCGSVASELPLFTRLGYRRGRKEFAPISASVTQKHMLVTGASAGLGYATALDLASRGASLTLVMRDKVKAEETLAALQTETGNSKLRYELADLSLMKDVEALVARLRKRGEPIDVLINNAGALFSPRSETSEGLEQSFALLLLSPYKLTMGLKPLLLKSEAARVINVVSGGMYSQKLEVDRLQNAPSKRYSGSVAYAREKRALMVLTEEWAKEWKDDGIVVNAMHPGWADTPGVQRSLPEFRTLTQSVLRSAEEGADTIVWLAVASEAGATSGHLFLDRKIKPTHFAKKTQETPSERKKLLPFLARH